MESDPQSHGAPVILIAHEVLERITADAARYAGKKERGGIFIGLRRGPHVQIADVTLPMRWDFGTLISFQRSARGHQDAALKRWRESEHTMDWVGEWHSHPESDPNPSSIDLHSWNRIVRDRAAPMVFLIVGFTARWVGLSVPGRTVPLRYFEAETSAAGIAFMTNERLVDSAAVNSSS